MLLGVLDLDLVVADAVSDRHGEVRNGGKGGDEGSQDVEHAFLLQPAVNILDSKGSRGRAVEDASHLRLGHGRPSHRMPERR